MGPPTKAHPWCVPNVKCHHNRLSSYQVIRIWIFLSFRLESPIHAPKISVFGGFYPKNLEAHRSTPERHLLARNDMFWALIGPDLTHRWQKNKKERNKCVSKTDTNTPFAFQIAFPRGTDFTGFLQGGSKSRDLQSEISVRIESRIESADSRFSFSVNFFYCHIGQMCGFVKNIARSLLGN